MANVRVIPATGSALSAQGKNSEFRQRVAAYARVSTDSDEQLTSYEAQVDYYTKLIQGREIGSSSKYTQMRAFQRLALNGARISSRWSPSRPLVITEFDETLWLAVIDTATVAQDSTMAFRFKNGAEVTV